MATFMKPINFTQLLDENRDFYFIYRLAQDDKLYNSDVNPVNRIISNSQELIDNTTIDEELKRVILLGDKDDLLQ